MLGPSTCAHYAGTRNRRSRDLREESTREKNERGD